jgi:hypothetical protein
MNRINIVSIKQVHWLRSYFVVTVEQKNILCVIAAMFPLCVP